MDLDLWVKSAIPPFLFTLSFYSVSNAASIIPVIPPKREQLRDYWPIYHPQQSALKIEFLIALQMAGASATDTAMHRVPCDVAQAARLPVNLCALCNLTIKTNEWSVSVSYKVRL